MGDLGSRHGMLAPTLRVVPALRPPELAADA